MFYIIISGEHFLEYFQQSLFYYIVQIFYIWLHEADFIMAMLLRCAMWPVGLLFIILLNLISNFNILLNQT